MSKQVNQHAELMKSLKSMSKQTGFTMIELMIAIVLGLLVTAAALAIFLGGQKSLNTQNGMGSLQQGAIFGLSQVLYGVRHANLDTTLSLVVTPTTRGSGIIFSENNFPYITDTSIATASNYAKTGNFTAENVTSTSATVKSDQLVIQFNSKAVKEAGSAAYTPTIQDCEGNLVPLTLNGANYVTVQRYYVAPMPASQQNTKKDRYALWCDASYYNKTGKPGEAFTNGVGVGDNAQMLITDVDAFKVRFGVKNSTTGSMRYLGINEYKALAGLSTGSSVNSVVSVEIGVLARSADTVGRDNTINLDKQFTIAGQSVGINYGPDKESAPRYLREAFNQVVALRNAQGVN